jgi:ribosomal protein S27AE
MIVKNLYQWRKAVLERDNYTCQRCGNRGLIQHAHHLRPTALHPGLKLETDNGEDLCEFCHQTLKKARNKMYRAGRSEHTGLSLNGVLQKHVSVIPYWFVQQEAIRLTTTEAQLLIDYELSWMWGPFEGMYVCLVPKSTKSISPTA